VTDNTEKRTDREHLEQILCEEDIGRLALAVDNEPYVVPINYAYVDGRILLHCALDGKKLDFIRKNPNVCFEVSRQHGRPAPHAGDLCDAPFESVICFGIARILDDVEERCTVLNEFQLRFVTPDKPSKPITVERVAKCGAIEITVKRMTGRRRAGKEKASWEWDL